MRLRTPLMLEIKSELTTCKLTQIEAAAVLCVPTQSHRFTLWVG